MLFAPSVERALPGRLRDVGRRRAARLDPRGRGATRPRGVDDLSEALQPRPPAARLLRPEDAQQTAVVRRLVRDLNVPVEIRVVPTVRDDGLAVVPQRSGSRQRARGESAAPRLATRDAGRAQTPRRPRGGLRRGCRLRATSGCRRARRLTHVSSTTSSWKENRHDLPSRPVHEGLAHRPHRPQESRREARDGHGLRPPGCPARGRGRRRHHPRGRLRGGQRPRLRHDSAGHGRRAPRARRAAAREPSGRSSSRTCRSDRSRSRTRPPWPTPSGS